MLENIRIVLINTSHPGNIGASARAMKTMGLSNLYLVAPQQFPHDKASELSSPRAKFAGKPHISGTKGGHTLNLHQFARDGATLLGRLEGIENGIVKFGSDLHNNLAAADRAEAEFTKAGKSCRAYAASFYESVMLRQAAAHRVDGAGVGCNRFCDQRFQRPVGDEMRQLTLTIL